MLCLHHGSPHQRAFLTNTNGAANITLDNLNLASFGNSSDASTGVVSGFILNGVIHNNQTWNDPNAPYLGFLIPLDSLLPREDNPAQLRFPLGGGAMYSPPPLRGQPVLANKKVLLIDRNQPTRDVRIRVLQSHGVEVHAAKDLSGARFLWQPNVYDLILLDVRRHLPGEALEFYEQIRSASPNEHFAFLVGPPAYLTRRWPGEVTELDSSQGQWGATVRRFLTAA